MTNVMPLGGFWQYTHSLITSQIKYKDEVEMILDSPRTVDRYLTLLEAKEKFVDMLTYGISAQPQLDENMRTLIMAMSEIRHVVEIRSLKFPNGTAHNGQPDNEHWAWVKIWEEMEVSVNSMYKLLKKSSADVKNICEKMLLNVYKELADVDIHDTKVTCYAASAYARMAVMSKNIGRIHLVIEDENGQPIIKCKVPKSTAQYKRKLCVAHLADCPKRLRADPETCSDNE